MKQEKKKHLLLVEDEAIIALNQAKVLENNGFSVTTCNSGKEAVKKYSAPPFPDLVLMDIDLGSGLDGTEAARQILEIQDVPIVFLSSHTDKEIVEKTEEITNYGYVVKGTGETVLITSIKMAFKLHAAYISVQNQKKAIREKEELLKETGKIAKLGGWELKPDTQEVTWTDETYRIHEVPIGEKPALLKAVKFFHPEDRAVLEQAIQKAIDNAQPYSLKLRFITAKGKGLWVHTRCTPMVEDGRVVLLKGTIQDITEEIELKKQAENERNRLYSLMETSPVAITLLDTEGNITYANNQAQRLFGLAKEGMSSKTYNDPEWKIESIDGTAFPVEELPFLQVKRTGKPVFNIEHAIIIASGEKRYLSVNASPLLVNYVFQGVIAVVLDITDKIQLEKDLSRRERQNKLLFEASADAVLFMRGDRFIDCNTAAVEMMGFSSKESLLQKCPVELSPETQPDGRLSARKHGKLLKAAIEHGTSRFDWELVRADGSPLFVEVQLTLLDMEEGIPFMNVAWRDITKRTLAEARLKTMEWLLDKAKVKRLETEERYVPEYGDLSRLNESGLIYQSSGTDNLHTLTSDIMDLMETSVAVYEIDGSYAYGLFSSGWCRAMDAATRVLCGTKDNIQALKSGKWLCHEDCWRVSEQAMKTEKEEELVCTGGLHIYAIPIKDDEGIIGAINFAYGNPPQNEKKIHMLSKKTGISEKQLLENAKEYKQRPPFIIALAKKRLKSIARLIGEMAAHFKTKKLLEEREAYLKSIFRASPVGIGALIKKKVTSVNKAMSFISGYTENELKAEGLSLLFPKIKEGTDFLGEAENRMKENGSASFEKSITTKTGEGKDVLIYLAPIHEQADNGELIFCVLDVTERKKAHKRTEELLREKQLLLKETHHRVKNDMNTIYSLLSLQAATIDNKKAVASIQEAQNRIVLMHNIYQILYKKEKLRELPINVYLDTITDNLINTYDSYSEIDLETHFEEIEVPTEKAFPIGIIINELVTNSYKYAFPNGKKGVVRADLKKTGTGEIMVTVTDTGVGVPEHVIHKVSLGFGLTLVKAFSEQLNGSFTVRNLPQNKGACFEVILKLPEQSEALPL